MRGVLHQHAFFAALAAGAVLIAAADGGRHRLAAAVYVAGLAGLLGVSALYHRVTWSPGARRWMRRLDHAMIFVLIAATATPVALVVSQGTERTVLLAIMWGAAAAGVLMELVWTDAPKWVNATVYVGVGLCGLLAIPSLAGYAAGALALLIAGGVLYTAGAVIYATGRPNPAPLVFGYHEVFHALVVAAAALHFAAVGIVVL
jgi:hemolysin III